MAVILDSISNKLENLSLIINDFDKKMLDLYNYD